MKLPEKECVDIEYSMRRQVMKTIAVRRRRMKLILVGEGTK
jgi:hypothetical protein